MGIERIYDAQLVGIAAAHFLKSEDKVDPIDWVSNKDNIVLQNDRGDLALFEKGVRHIYTGHYYFKSRGRAAITAATEFLDTIFNTCYNIEVLMGLTPVEHLGAKWLTRQLGFKSYGFETVGDQEFEVFILTKKEFNT